MQRRRSLSLLRAMCVREPLVRARAHARTRAQACTSESDRGARDSLSGLPTCAKNSSPPKAQFGRHAREHVKVGPGPSRSRGYKAVEELQLRFLISPELANRALVTRICSTRALRKESPLVLAEAPPAHLPVELLAVLFHFLSRWHCVARQIHAHLDCDPV
jgi:hypothetical protein